MSTEAATRLLTAEEFYELPDPIEGGKMELVRGEVVTHRPLTYAAGIALGEVIGALHPFVSQHQLGLVGLRLGFLLGRDPDLVRTPNLSFLVSAAGGADANPPETYVDGAPTLAIEVVAPDDLDWVVQEKLRDYLNAGTQRVWLVRPRLKTVTVHRPDWTERTLRIDGTLTSDDAGFPVEGFALPLEELFG